VIYINGAHGTEWVSVLRRPPVLKTFRIHGKGCTDFIQAESRDAALAKLAEMLEEVP
jgi:hypothetical protein